MLDNSSVMIALGALFAAGLLCHELGKRTAIPRVTLLLAVGMLSSSNALNLIPQPLAEQFPLVSQIALCMVGFLLGEQFVYHALQKSGRRIWIVTLVEALVAMSFVLVLLLLIGVPTVLAILLASIAPTTAPAASLDVIRENGFSGEVPEVLLKVIAIDDLVGISLFAIGIAIAQLISGGPDFASTLSLAIRELVLAIGIGLLLGWPMAKLTGRLNKGEPLLMEALAFILLCGGIALWMQASYLLSSIVLGAVVANFARHHERPFHAIEGIATPFLIVFFILAGYQFDISQVAAIGGIGIAYLLARSTGKIMGGYLGSRVAGYNETMQRTLGWCLLPQAGVALGLALMAADHFPVYAGQLLSVLVGTTIVFELVGPILMRYKIARIRPDSMKG